MGAGKTTLGRLLAELTNKTFVDSDQVIVERAGADIPWIFDLEGEAGFRQRESQVIAELTQTPNIILATGGGAVLLPENRAYLSSGGQVVYLRTQVSTQVRRTQRDRNRPMLQTAKPKETMQRLMQEREPFYLEVADVIVDTDQMNPKVLARELVEALQLTS
jgi:shikimate kinase